MKRKRIIRWIWISSIAVGCAIIMLQGYWLFNQYRYNMSLTADELGVKTLAAWDNYKVLQKQRLKRSKENLKGYNTNLNQKTVYISDEIKDTSLTNWDITLSLTKLDTIVSSLLTEEKSAKEMTTTKELDFLFDNATEVLDAYEKREDTINSFLNLPDSVLLDSIINSPQKINQLINESWKVSTMQKDSLTIKKFRFATNENKNLIYDAVDLYLSFQNIPFDKNEMDSLIAKEIQLAEFVSDTLTLPLDSVLWQPKIAQSLSLKKPSIIVSIPYNTLEKRVMNIVIPIPVNRILQTMFWQILITAFLIALLGIALGVQIKIIAQQMRINQLRQNFVNTTLHELKRPVQTLKSIVAYLQNQESDTSQVLSDARIETDNLTSYLQKLREVNEGESISDSIHLSHFDFTELLRENVKIIQRNTQKNLHITTHLPSDRVMLTADRISINNVLTNLLENAIKYSGNTVNIDISVDNKPKNVRFSITDNGFGIAHSEQNQVMEPFYRSKNEKVASLPGMGLGLSYVKMVVDAHRGNISIHSELNKGTTISIEIPQL